MLFSNAEVTGVWKPLDYSLLFGLAEAFFFFFFCSCIFCTFSISSACWCLRMDLPVGLLH